MRLRLSLITLMGLLGFSLRCPNVRPAAPAVHFSSSLLSLPIVNMSRLLSNLIATPMVRATTANGFRSIYSPFSSSSSSSSLVCSRFFSSSLLPSTSTLSSSVISSSPSPLHSSLSLLPSSYSSSSSFSSSSACFHSSSFSNVSSSSPSSSSPPSAIVSSSRSNVPVPIGDREVNEFFQKGKTDNGAEYVLSTVDALVNWARAGSIWVTKTLQSHSQSIHSHSTTNQANDGDNECSISRIGTKPN